MRKQYHRRGGGWRWSWANIFPRPDSPLSQVYSLESVQRRRYNDRGLWKPWGERIRRRLAEPWAKIKNAQQSCALRTLYSTGRPWNVSEQLIHDHNWSRASTCHVTPCHANMLNSPIRGWWMLIPFRRHRSKCIFYVLILLRTTFSKNNIFMSSFLCPHPKLYSIPYIICETR